jgi:hypothetical protein
MIVPIKQFWSKQLAFLHVEPDVNLDICIYQGGYGSGKTMIGAILGIVLSSKYQGLGITGLVVAKVYPTIRDTTLRTYIELLQMMGYKKGRDWVLNKNEGRLYFPRWGNDILFRHMQDPEAVKSINAAWAHGEEISQLSDEDANMLISRVRQPQVPRRRVFGTTNPQAVKGWIHEQYGIPKQDVIKVVEIDPITGLYGDVIDVIPLPTYNNKTFIQDTAGTLLEVIHKRRVIAPTTDNKALPASYVEAMRDSYDPEYFRIFVMGEDGDYMAGLVTQGWSELNEIETEYDPDLPIHLSCDFNVDPMMWTLSHRFNGEFHFFDEMVVENTNTLACVNEFHDRYPDHKAGIIINGDASGDNRGTLSEEENATNYTIMENRLKNPPNHHKRPGFGYPGVRLDIHESNPNVVHRIAAWNSAVCSEAGIRRVFAGTKCKWLRWNVKNLKFAKGTSDIEEPTKTQLEKTRTAKFTKHIWDAASYHVEKYAPVKREPPPNNRKGPIVKDFRLDI